MNLISFFFIIFLTALPIFELRLSIPIGIIVLGENPLLVIAIAMIANITVAIILYFFLYKAVLIARRLSFFDKFYTKKIEKIQKKIHPKIEKYGVLGLGIFIGIPLPGSGVYTGVLAAEILGFNFKKLMKAVIIGILIAGTIVGILSVGFEGLLLVIGFNEGVIERFAYMRSLFS